MIAASYWLSFVIENVYFALCPELQGCYRPILASLAGGNRSYSLSLRSLQSFARSRAPWMKPRTKTISGLIS